MTNVDSAVGLVVSLTTGVTGTSFTDEVLAVALPDDCVEAVGVMNAVVVFEYGEVLLERTAEVSHLL